MKSLSVMIILLTIFTCAIQAEEKQSVDEKQKITLRMKELSDSVKKNGKGGAGYANVLASDFTRWRVGSEKISNRVSWVKSISDWFDSGWRVKESVTDIVELKIVGDHALSRRIVTETYAGPKGEKESYRSGVVEVWIKQKGNWFLLQASVTPKKIQ